VEFYRILKRLAISDGLENLVGIIREIEKDELRHLAGLEELIDLVILRDGMPRASDLWIARGILAVLRIDIDLRGWAVHNRKVRRRAVAIGIDPEEMAAQANRATRRALEFT
jgi:hypothetical protein